MNVETADSGMRARREHVAVDGRRLQVDVRWADEKRAGADSYDYAVDVGRTEGGEEARDFLGVGVISLVRGTLTDSA